MKVVLISLGLGLVLGIIDTVPMYIKKLDSLFIASAFALWVVLGLTYPFVQLPYSGAMKGLTLALVLSMPTWILIWRVDSKAVWQVLLTTALLGLLLGLGNKLLLGL